MQKPEGHVVALALPLWGHTKPLCALLGKIVRARRVHATLFTSHAVTNRILEEIGRQFDPAGEVELGKLIRVHSLPCSPIPLDFDTYESAFIEGYTALYERKPTPSAQNSDAAVNETAERPQLVILDPLAFRSLKGIRHVSGSSVPIYAWHYGAVSALIYLCGPETMGGNGDLAEKISKIGPVETEIRNRKIEAIFRRNEGEIITIPGMPPMYDYEFIPQALSIRMPLAEVAILFQHAHRFFSDCDGVINNTCQFYESSPLNALQAWLDTRPILCLGPLLSPFRDTEAPRSPESIRVQAFLDAAFEKFGANSVVYVSFGTLLWPENPEYLWTIIDVLIQQEIPFILSHASPVASIPEEVAARIERAKIGYMAPWLPQELILHHKACGWFMSHCGHNSVMESLDAGVPLICWPFLSDADNLQMRRLYQAFITSDTSYSR